MSDESEFSLSKYRGDGNGQRSRRGQGNRGKGRRIGGGNATRILGTGVPETEVIVEESPVRRPYDPFRLLDALTRGWYWMALAGVILATIAFIGAINVTKYGVRVQLFRRPTLNAFAANSAESILPPEISLQTLFSLMRSPRVLERTSERMTGLGIPMSKEEIAEAVKIYPDRNPDFVNLIISGKKKEHLAQLANVYAEEVVAFTRKIQQDDAGEINQYLTKQLTIVSQELDAANAKLTGFLREAEVVDFEKEIEAYLAQRNSVDFESEKTRVELETLGVSINSLKQNLAQQSGSSDYLQSAQETLRVLIAEKGYGEAHPAVQQQRSLIANLKKMGPTEGTNSLISLSRGNSLANALFLQLLDYQNRETLLKKQKDQLEVLRERYRNNAKNLSEKAGLYASLKSQRQNLEVRKNLYTNRQREAQLLQENALGYFRVDSPAIGGDVGTERRLLMIGFMTTAGAFAGVFLSAMLLLLTEFMDTRLKTVADIQRVTRLPVFATLGDLAKMTPTEQVNWAFRTLTVLQGKLNGSPDKSLVCGFISAKHGEGRSTWINLLVSAASQRGLRVLTVATKPNDTAADVIRQTPKDTSLLPVGPKTTLGGNVLAFPAQVTEQFNDPQAQPVVHIPLPGWVWNLERRKQWQSALAHWREIDNLVMLIELPPASQPESVLLAENLPQVIWLSNSGSADAEETRQHLETLRHAQCQVVGAVLNRAPNSAWKRRFTSLFRRATVAVLISASALGSVAGLAAEEGGVAVAAVQPRAALGSASGAGQAVGGEGLPGGARKAIKRAAWQEKLTLGPGDVLDFTIWGRPELSRTNIVVGPDGRVGYLQVQEVKAAGLTIDELRAKLDRELDPFYPAARTIITPVSFNSKKYYVLGKVVNRGAYPLDRPITVLEAVARARGLETGFIERNHVETADLSRSFLARGGKRVVVDFERLFRQGDLSQNIPLEPDDYLYFPPSDLNEIYVLGEVLSPGVTMFSQDASVITALTARGGFTPRAYKKKILIVRGSLEQPETFVVNTTDVLAGRSPDFKLQARDIVYVNARPWIKVEELLDLAAEAFVQAAVTTWVGGNVGPVISRPITPD